MKLDKSTLEFLKKKYEQELIRIKENVFCYTDSERSLMDGKELAIESVIDDINDLLEEIKVNS